MNERLLSRAWRTLREEGPRGVWFRSLETVGYRRRYLLRRPLCEPLPDRTTSLPLEIDWLTPGTLADYRAFRAAGDDSAAVWLGSGHRCLVARHEGRIVGAMWCSTSGARSAQMGGELPLAPGEVYQFDAYTTPAARGAGISTAVSVAWLRQLRDEGRSAATLLVLPENRAALRAYAKAGYRIAAIVRCLRLGPWWRLLSLSPVAAVRDDGRAAGRTGSLPPPPPAHGRAGTAPAEHAHAP